MPKVALLAVVALFAVGCGVDPPSTSPTPLPAHGTPAKIELSASSGVAEHGGTAAVTARVLDAFSAALPAVTVAFRATAGDLAATSVVTDGNGLARTTLTGPPGLVSVQAQAADVHADVTLTVQPVIVNPPPVPVPPVPPTPEPPPPNIPFTVAIGIAVDATAPHTLFFGLSGPGTVVSVTWNFGDGSVVTTTGSRAATTRHTYAAAGSQQVTATATDSRGRVASDGVTVIVP